MSVPLPGNQKLAEQIDGPCCHRSTNMACYPKVSTIARWRKSIFATHDFGADLPPYQYNLLAEQRVRLRFGFDIVVVKKDTDGLARAIEFFAQVRQRPSLKKGLSRIKV